MKMSLKTDITLIMGSELKINPGLSLIAFSTGKKVMSSLI